MAGVSAFIRTTGLGRLVRTLEELIESAQKEGDWWVGTIVVYAPMLEHGTSKMRAQPYFQPAILRAVREVEGVKARPIGNRRSGRSLWALMVDPDAEATRLPGQSPLAQRIALALEREVKEVIKEKGLIDTGHLRASFTAAPTLPRMKRESYESMDSTATSRRTGRQVKRSEIVDRSR